MGSSRVTLPPGFELEEQPEPKQQPKSIALPPGFELDTAPATPQGPTIGPDNSYLNRIRTAFAGPDTAQGAHDVTKPIVDLQALIPPGEGTVRNFVRGLATEASGFTTPANIELMFVPFGRIGGPVVKRLVSGGFALEGIRNLWQTVPEFKEKIESGDYDGAAKLAGEMLVSGAVTGVAGREAVKPGKIPPVEAPHEEPAPPAEAVPAPTPEAAAPEAPSPVEPPQPKAKRKVQRGGAIPPKTVAIPPGFEVETAPQAATIPPGFELEPKPEEKAAEPEKQVPPEPQPKAEPAPASAPETPEPEAEKPAEAQPEPAPVEAPQKLLGYAYGPELMGTDLKRKIYPTKESGWRSKYFHPVYEVGTEDLVPTDTQHYIKSKAADIDKYAERIREDQGKSLPPLDVKYDKETGKFLVQNGSRRMMAARLAGLKTVPVAISKGAEDFQAEAPQEFTGNAQPEEKASIEDRRQQPFQEGSPTPRYVALNSLLGGLQEPIESFAKEDILPAAKNVAQTVRDAADDIMRAVAPTVRGAGGEEVGVSLRAGGGKMARAFDQAKFALRAAKKLFDARKPQENYAFIDRMETGQKQPTAEEQPIADVLRKMFDERRSQVQALGNGKLQEFYENYFPHIWKDPRKATDAFRSIFARKPIEGSKKFLKKRTHLTFADGLAAGLEPVSDNPVDLALLKVREMDRYIMAHQVLNEAKANGTAKFFRGKGPAGWKKIDDPIGGVWSRGDDGELILRGNYWMPDGAAQVLNNHLSPGLRRHGWYRVLLGTNNTLNQFQLGFSAFHLGFTSADAAVSRAALGFEQVMRGHPIKGTKTLASTVVAPFTTALKGNKLIQAWYKPGSQGAEIARIANEAMRAGARVKMDEMYHTRAMENAMLAWRHGNVIGSVLRLPFAAVDAVSRPIMDYLVPRQKLGVFMDMARFEMEEHNHKLQTIGADPSLTPKQKAAKKGSEQDALRESMRNAWDSVENRMGQMTYDNLFWNRTAKDIAMLTTRSVGWNLGTLREIGGGIMDLTKQPLNKATGKPVNLKKISYLMGLVTVGATMGAMYQYLRTGKGPEELKDYFFPKTGELDANGRPQRVEMPLYIKDVYRYGTEPARTLEGKTGPLVNAIAEMVENKDFYGNQIVNFDDPFVKQLAQAAEFVGKQTIPFGVRNYEKQSKENQSLVTKLQNFVGITPAPSSVDQTSAEKLAGQYMQKHMPSGGKTPAQAATRETRKQLERDAKKDPRAAHDEAVQDVDSGKFTQRQALDALKASRLTPLQKTVQNLSLDEAIKVYQAGTGEERNQLKKILYGKASRAYGALNRAQRQELVERIRPLGLQ